ncbi:hypothetical protein QBC39DRAFT_333897 [Podospora conica]|nr:hypothetical protein QBC39DRAFT_333897 [Schizothecium conicum]
MARMSTRQASESVPGVSDDPSATDAQPQSPLATDSDKDDAASPDADGDTDADGDEEEEEITITAIVGHTVDPEGVTFDVMWVGWKQGESLWKVREDELQMQGTSTEIINQYWKQYNTEKGWTGKGWRPCDTLPPYTMPRDRNDNTHYALQVDRHRKKGSKYIFRTEWLRWGGQLTWEPASLFCNPANFAMVKEYVDKRVGPSMRLGREFWRHLGHNQAAIARAMRALEERMPPVDEE